MGPLDSSMPSTPAKARNGKKRIALVAGVLIAGLIPIVQSTFAANVTLSSGAIEFGQGMSAVSACDTSVTLTPHEVYDNAEETFTLTTVTLVDATGVATIGNSCAGKHITLSAWHGTDAVALGVCGFGLTMTTGPTYGATSDDLDVCTVTNDGTTVTADMSLAAVLADQVTKFTIETN